MSRSCGSRWTRAPIRPRPADVQTSRVPITPIKDLGGTYRPGTRHARRDAHRPFARTPGSHEGDPGQGPRVRAGFLRSRLRGPALRGDEPDRLLRGLSGALPPLALGDGVREALQAR